LPIFLAFFSSRRRRATGTTEIIRSSKATVRAAVKTVVFPKVVQKKKSRDRFNRFGAFAKTPNLPRLTPRPLNNEKNAGIIRT